MVITHNISAMNANRMFGMVNTSMSKSTEKLPSGYRINRSADDAAESRIRDTDMAEMVVSNSKDNILLQAGQAMIAQANNQTMGVLTISGT